MFICLAGPVHLTSRSKQANLFLYSKPGTCRKRRQREAQRWEPFQELPILHCPCPRGGEVLLVHVGFSTTEQLAAMIGGNLEMVAAVGLAENSAVPCDTYQRSTSGTCLCSEARRRCGNSSRYSSITVVNNMDIEASAELRHVASLC